MCDINNRGWFKRHLFSYCLIAGVTIGGLTGRVIGGGFSEGLFMTVIGMFLGIFAGFMVAMFISD